MELSVQDAAAAFKVSENTIYRWVKEANLPARLVNGQPRFNQAELLEWATVHRAPVSPEVFREPRAPRAPELSLVEALQAGGISYDVDGPDKQAVLRAVVERLPLPDGTDRDALLQLFLAREALGATGVGHGIAIPHPRHPLIFLVQRPLLHLCFLARPLDFKAPDREAVHTLFVLICPTIQAHLHMLARVACLVRDEPLRAVLQRRGPAAEILAEVRRVQDALERAPTATRSPRG